MICWFSIIRGCFRLGFLGEGWGKFGRVGLESPVRNPTLQIPTLRQAQGRLSGNNGQKWGTRSSLLATARELRPQPLGQMQNQVVVEYDVLAFF